MPAIHVMMKPASGLCNMRCQYCFYADEMEKRSQASYGIIFVHPVPDPGKKG